MVIEGERQETREPRIKLIPFDEITLSPKQRYLVGGLIPRVGITLIWGPPKSGKSFWTFDVAMHVALGWKYRSRRVHQGPVVYCAFEGQSGIEARCEAFRQRFLAEEPAAIPFYLQPLRLDLVTDRAELIGAIQASIDQPAAAVVLDTLNRSLKGSESSDEDMAAYVAAADAIREAFGCAVVIVHHCGVDGSRPRGHTGLTGAVDAQLAVRRDASDNILVEVELAKDGPQGDIIASHLEVVEVGIDEDGEIVTSCVIVPAENVEGGRRSDRSVRRTKGTQIAFRALQQAIDEAGEIPPASDHIPAETKTVTLAVWRKYAYARGISGSDQDRARQAAFKRSSEALFAAGKVGTWEGQCWLV